MYYLIFAIVIGIVIMYFIQHLDRRFAQLITFWLDKRYQYNQDTLNHYDATGYRETSGRTLHDMMDESGPFGEFLVYVVLKSLGEKNILVNTYIPRADGKTSEIDLVVINRKGIHVIESKNYKGLVDVDADKDKWYRLSHWKDDHSNEIDEWEKEYFYSPVKQNQGHIEALAKYLPGVTEEMFTSLIVFGPKTKIRGFVPNSKRLNVSTVHWFPFDFKDKCAQLPDVLSPAKIEELYQKLKTCTLVSDSIKQKHIEDIHDIQM